MMPLDGFVLRGKQDKHECSTKHNQRKPPSNLHDARVSAIEKKPTGMENQTLLLLTLFSSSGVVVKVATNGLPYWK
jgi:hypothetical protein